MRKAEDMRNETTQSRPTVALSPELVVLLKAGPLLKDWLGGLNKAAQAKVCQTLAQDIQVLVDELAIPAQVTVTLQANVEDESDSHAADQILRLSVDGRVCRYSIDTALWVFSWVSQRHRAPGDDLDTIKSWLGELSGAKQDKPDPRLAFISLLCVEILKHQPGCLIGEAQAQAFLERWKSPEGNGKFSELPPPSQVQPVLRALLEQWIALYPAETILETLREGYQGRYPEVEISERLIADLAEEVVRIWIHPETLKALTLAIWQPARSPESEEEATAAPGYDTLPPSAPVYPNYFASVRKELVDNFGILFPDLQFCYDLTLELGSFAFQINDLRSQTYLGLAEAERLALVSGPEAGDGLTYQCHPFSMAPCLRLAAESGEDPQALIYPLEFLALSLKRFVRQYAGRFINGTELERMVTDLESSFPQLVAYVRALTSRGKITRLLRDLVDEGVPLLNLPVILEAYLDYERLVATAPLDWFLMDDQPDALTEELPSDFIEVSDVLGFVRNRLKNEISYLYGGGPAEIEVFQLAYTASQELINALKDWTANSKEEGIWEGLLPEDLHDQLIRAIEVKLTALADSAEASTQETPILLTDVKLRPALRYLLRDEFPRLAVLAYSELAGWLRVKTRDWIELGWSA